MKYYVYIEQKNDKTSHVILVKDVKLFASEDYNANTMRFSGVVIDAANPHLAKTAYDFPFKSTADAQTTIEWIDEPIETKLKTKLKSLLEEIDQMKTKTEALKSAQIQYDIVFQQLELSLSIVKLFNALNTKVAELAQCIRKSTTDNPEVTSQDLYKRLKDKYIEQFKLLTFKFKA